MCCVNRRDGFRVYPIYNALPSLSNAPYKKPGPFFFNSFISSSFDYNIYWRYCLRWSRTNYLNILPVDLRDNIKHSYNPSSVRFLQFAEYKDSSVIISFLYHLYAVGSLYPNISHMTCFALNNGSLISPEYFNTMSLVSWIVIFFYCRRLFKLNFSSHQNSNFGNSCCSSLISSRGPWIDIWDGCSCFASGTYSRVVVKLFIFFNVIFDS